MTTRERGALARSNFEKGYNCAQSVLLAFCDVTGLSERDAARLASGLGGGMGRMREVCGAVSASFLVLGAAQGYDDPQAKEEKSRLYAEIRACADRFKEENHSIICRDLLIDTATTPGGEPEERTAEYYERRPCAHYVQNAAELLDAALKEQAGPAIR